MEHIKACHASYLERSNVTVEKSNFDATTKYDRFPREILKTFAKGFANPSCLLYFTCVRCVYHLKRSALWHKESRREILWWNKYINAIFSVWEFCSTATVLSSNAVLTSGEQRRCLRGFLPRNAHSLTWAEAPSFPLNRLTRWGVPPRHPLKRMWIHFLNKMLHIWFTSSHLQYGTHSETDIEKTSKCHGEVLILGKPTRWESRFEKLSKCGIA